MVFWPSVKSLRNGSSTPSNTVIKLKNRPKYRINVNFTQDRSYFVVSFHILLPRSSPFRCRASSSLGHDPRLEVRPELIKNNSSHRRRRRHGRQKRCPTPTPIPPPRSSDTDIYPTHRLYDVAMPRLVRVPDQVAGCLVRACLQQSQRCKLVPVRHVGQGQAGLPIPPTERRLR